MATQYIFQMYRLSKVYPPDKTVLNDITLAFLPGAKIGVLGYNGAGKSTVLRIMAGIDTEFRGDAQLAPGATVGPARAGAPSRREQGRARQRRGRRGRDARAARPLQRAGRQLLRRDGRRVRRRRRRSIDAADAWNLDTNVEYAMDALRLPPADADVTHALRRRAPPRRAVPPAAGRARPAAARRAHQPPRRRVGRLARAPPRRVQGHRRGRDPRSLLPRQRRGLDPRARPLARDPLRGQLLELARAEAEAHGAGGEDREGAPAHDRRRARLGAPEPQGPPDQAEGAPAELRGARRPGAQRQARRGPDPHPDLDAPGQRRRRGRGPAQGLRRQPAHRGPQLHAAARAGSSASSAPTARARRRCSG